MHDLGAMIIRERSQSCLPAQEMTYLIGFLVQPSVMGRPSPHVRHDLPMHFQIPAVLPAHDVACET